MDVTGHIGPEYQDLKPLKPAQVAGRFPVYTGLVDTLAAVGEHSDDTLAHVLGVCAAYAYADSDTLAMLMTRMGLPGSHVQRIAIQVDPMFIASTAYVVQSADGRVVILAYRGTEPTRFISWLTDIDLYPDRIAVPFDGRDRAYEVHGGFYRNVRATRYLVVAALQRALEGRSVCALGDDDLAPMQTLYVTGHSLGGAMASLMGIMLAKDPYYAELAAVLRGVYTYGQPMLGGPDLAAACDADPFLSARVVRHVFERDVVPHLPPRDTGDFRHFGVERRYRGGWPWRTSTEPVEQMGHVAELVVAPLSFVARQFPPARHLPFRYRLDDHLPHRYVAALTPPGVPNEYGDDPVAAVGPDR